MEVAECGLTVVRMNETINEHTIGLIGYRPNMQCDWIIEVPDGEQIDIHFLKFDLEDADSSGQCSFDYLRLTDEDVKYSILLF